MKYYYLGIIRLILVQKTEEHTELTTSMDSRPLLYPDITFFSDSSSLFLHVG